MLCNKNGQSFTLPDWLPACLPSVYCAGKYSVKLFFTAHTSFRLLQGILKEIPYQSFATSKLYHVFSPFSTHFSQQRVEKLDYKSIFFARKKLPPAKAVAILPSHALSTASAAVDWIFRYGNEALAKLEKTPLEQLIDHAFGSIFPNMDAKWLRVYERTALYGETLEITDYSPEIDTDLRIICFPTFRGHCGCILFDQAEIQTVRTGSDK